MENKKQKLDQHAFKASGWVKIHRKLLKNKIFGNEKLLKVWIWCLLKASFAQKSVIIGLTNIDLLPGQFIFGRNKNAKELCIKSVTLYRYVLFLQKNNYINIKSFNKYSIVTVLNWDKYQTTEQVNKQVIEQQTNNKRTTNEHIQECIKNNNTCGDFITHFNFRFGTKYLVTKQRQVWFKNRLANFSFEQLKQAVNNTYQIPNYKGENQTGWSATPDFYLRNDQNLDRALNEKPKTQKKLIILNSQ